MTRNNLEAAEEIVRQLRLRDVGGIVVIDFIDMVLESNRDLVLRRLTECLGRDRTKHQVAEVTSLGLVQMTRKRVGEGLLEAFSEPCEHCKGRGVIVHNEPVDRRSGATSASPDEDERPSRNKRNRRGKPVEPVEELPVVDPERRRAAANAIAAIAAATTHHELAVEVEPESAEVPVAVPAVEVGSYASGAEPNGSGHEAPSDAGQEAASAAGREAVATSAPVVSTGSQPSSRPRRRRGASRPAGPPAAVSSVS